MPRHDTMYFVTLTKSASDDDDDGLLRQNVWTRSHNFLKEEFLNMTCETEESIKQYLITKRKFVHPQMHAAVKGLNILILLNKTLHANNIILTTDTCNSYIFYQWILLALLNALINMLFIFENLF